MATWAVRAKSRSIRRACELFAVSETSYRYEPKLSSENERIADWLVRLTHNRLWTYNNKRPNMALGGSTPRQKLALAA